MLYEVITGILVQLVLPWLKKMIFFLKNFVLLLILVFQVELLGIEGK